MGRAIDEGDAAVWGARIAFAAEMFHDPDVPLVPNALIEGYSEMRATEGDSSRADWWTPDGERIVRETMRLAAARGLQRIVLAGLSNGAIGAARLAPRMRGSFVGLVFVSGAPTDAAAPNVPVLAIHGRHDAMASVASVRSYAALHHDKYVDLDAGHLALLLRREESLRALRDWLAAR